MKELSESISVKDSAAEVERIQLQDQIKDRASQVAENSKSLKRAILTL